MLHLTRRGNVSTLMPRCIQAKPQETYRSYSTDVNNLHHAALSRWFCLGGWVVGCGCKKAQQNISNLGVIYNTAEKRSIWWVNIHNDILGWWWGAHIAVPAATCTSETKWRNVYRMVHSAGNECANERIPFSPSRYRETRNDTPVTTNK